MTDRWKRYYKEEYPKFWKTQVKKYISDEGYIWYYEKIFKSIRREMEQGKVLECGAGTGEPLALWFKASGYDYFGIDLSFELAKKFKECAGGKIIIGDIEALPFRNGYFDLVASISTTWYVEDFNKMFYEMYRICKNNGLIIFDVLNKMHISEFLEDSYAKFVRSDLGKFLRKIKNRLEGKVMIDSNPEQIGGVKMRTRNEIEKVLKRFNLDFKCEGFYVLLPLSLPILQNVMNFFYGGGVISKINVGKIFRKFRGLNLETFAAKLFYICKKH